MTAGIGARARYIWLTDICKCHLPNMLFTHATPSSRSHLRALLWHSSQAEPRLSRTHLSWSHLTKAGVPSIYWVSFHVVFFKA